MFTESAKMNLISELRKLITGENVVIDFTFAGSSAEIFFIHGEAPYFLIEYFNGSFTEQITYAQEFLSEIVFASCFYGKDVNSFRVTTAQAQLEAQAIKVYAQFLLRDIRKQERDLIDAYILGDISYNEFCYSRAVIDACWISSKLLNDNPYTQVYTANS